MENFLDCFKCFFSCIRESIETIVNNTFFWKTVYNIIDFIGIVAGIVVSIIAIVTFLGSYYFKRIKILGWYKSSNIYEGYKFSVSIQNRCLSTLTIKRVSIILDNIEEVVLFYPSNIFEDEGTQSNRSIEPFKTETFTSCGSTQPLFEKSDLEKYKKIVFSFIFSDNTQTNVRYKLKKIKRSKYKTLYPKQNVLRGVQLTEHMMYIVERTNTARPITQNIVFINGLIDSKIGVVSNIPPEHCQSAEKVKRYLENCNQGMIFNVYPNPYYKKTEEN